MLMHNQMSSEKNIFLAMMDTMMIKMKEIPTDRSTENVFIGQMIPHHEGAIEMANYEIKKGKDFRMIQLAKSILAEQTDEVQQMKFWLKQPAFPTNNTPVWWKLNVCR